VAALLVGSQEVAEELAQDAFLRLFERFDEVTNPAGFLRTVVVRLCLTWQRRHATEQRLVRKVGVERPSSIPEVDETWEALARLDPDRPARR
jgi:DNA-directed RNA polymerase specialized sigma24 family protein